MHSVSDRDSNYRVTFRGYNDSKEEDKEDSRDLQSVSVSLSSFYTNARGILNRIGRIAPNRRKHTDAKTNKPSNLGAKFLFTKPRVNTIAPDEYLNVLESSGSTVEDQRKEQGGARFVIENEVADIYDYYRSKKVAVGNLEYTEDSFINQISQNFQSSITEYVVEKKGNSAETESLWYVKHRDIIKHKCHYYCVLEKLESYYEHAFRQELFSLDLEERGSTYFLCFTGIMKNIGDKDKLEEWFSSGDHSTNYDIWNHDDGEGAEGEEDEDEPLFDWSKDKRFLFNRLLNRVQNKVNQIYMDGSYKCSMMIRQLTNKLLEYRFCCKNAQEKIGELIDEFMVDPLCDLDSKAGSVISDRSVNIVISTPGTVSIPSSYGNAAPSTLRQEQPIDSSILSRLGEILNSNVLNRKLPLISEIPKDFLYPFPMLKLNSITQAGFKPALKCFYNLFKLYHLKRWNWSLEDCDLDTMCIVYKMVTTLEKNNAASIAKVTTLSSSTQGSVYSYHLSSANSGQIISNYNRITSRGSKGVEDERNKIKVSSLPPESEEKYEIKVNGSIKETLRGRNHDELTRKLEYETRKEISSIVASLKPDTGNEERFFEGPHEQKYVWMFKQYRSQKLQDRRIIHPKISKLMDLSFNRFGNYWVIEDLRAIKMLEDNLKLYREQQKSEDPLDIEYNYIFTSPDKEWMIDLNKCVMNSIKFDREDPKFIESKAQGIIKHKGEMVETCRIHLKRAEDFTDMGEEEDPYGNIREYLRFLDSKESQAEIAKVIMELLSDDTQVCIEENKENEVFSIKNLKKNARTLWPELKHGRYFLRFLSESDQEGILNGSLNSLKSNNQLLILSVGMMFFLEELINPTRSLKRDKYSQKIRSIFEVDKFWDYSLPKTIEAIIPSQGEATEVFNSVGKFANIFKDKEMVPLRLQNTFLMLMFKSMELYYEKESLIKPVIVIPPWGETLEDLKDIIDPSELMVKISRCHVYDLGPSKSPWGVKNKDIPFLTESLENQSFDDALLCDFITIIGNDLLSNTGVPNPPLCVYPKYYFYMKN